MLVNFFLLWAAFILMLIAIGGILTTYRESDNLLEAVLGLALYSMLGSGAVILLMFMR